MIVAQFSRAAWQVYLKEMVDALRDRRTLVVVFLSSVLLGPAVLIAISGFVATLEQQAERREIVVDGLAHAPTLRNYLERQTYTTRQAPADYESQLRRSTLDDPVVVVPADFETALQRGDAPVLQVLSDSTNRRAESAAERVQRLLAGFARERATLNMAMRGLSPDVLEPLRVEEHDLGTAQSRATQITGMLPFFVIIAVLYGALNAALDTTAGERERGSLEPLLLNPTHRVALVIGKWAAAASLGMLIAVLGSFSFLPAQRLLRSDTLQAMFQYGWHEALMFLVVLLPFAAAISSVLMAVAIRCRTFKEAQANTAVLVLAVSMLPMVTIFSQTAEARWLLWVPALAQHSVMTRVLRGEAIGMEQALVPLGVCAAVAAAGIWLVATAIRRMTSD